ncbi:ABC transporter ATP-binding protein [Celeribacter indicus]|uniref:ABC transporter-like protein n=1 Tax=Celeribacter indicus TaxID=1208324 RepID=A0A0B5DXR7_9RHOB|nr:ATP-binding cassette domain-containing protein [Celeribacter indicus]AJE45541.1 ABC transporter-like protein [Celeribacter indicus]SDW86446.1 iron complex transport system ATP-binding protein [Celeribacter indicus]
MIDTRNLCVSLGGTPVLHDISVTVPAGRLTALVGPNGAGKSTLLAALGRLVEPRRGEVRLEGRPLEDWPKAQVALKLAILRQHTAIAPRLTVEDLVAFGRYPHSHGRMTDADRAEVRRAILRLDLEDFAGRYLDTLSGGQRQRALIAMTLAQQTGAILLDEPLNNLDLAHARRVMRIAREEAEAGRTVVVVLHDLTVAAAYADHVVAMKAGRVQAVGPVGEVLASGPLSELYDTEVEVIETGGRRIVLPV